MYKDIIAFIRNEFGKSDGFIGLHEPLFVGNERKYVMEAIDSTFVSSVGKFVDSFEKRIQEYTGAPYAVATVNGTAALHIALQLAGVKRDDLVITQPITFIATCNAIAYCGADPLFVDVDMDTLGLSPEKLEIFLKESVEVRNGKAVHKATGRTISACSPMHTFGHPLVIDKVIEVCNRYMIPVVEDSAESLGSKYKGQHTGTFGRLGVYSFNGNKTITCGGGGVIVTADESLAKLAKHITTQAKKPHPWNFDHDHIGYNYRMPNLNAALGCAQLEMLDKFIENKRGLASRYKSFFAASPVRYVDEPRDAYSNFWLNCILLKDRTSRDAFLKETNDSKVMTRPVWTPMNKLQMFANCITGDLSNSNKIEDCLVNIPSSPRA